MPELSCTSFSHKKKFGQNFLINKNVILQSAAAGELCENDVVLEIGPGQGVLTQELLRSPCRFIHSIEIDRSLESWLLPLEENSPSRLHFIWNDALKVDFSSLTPRPTKVLANIPYNITSQLIWKIITELSHLGLQRLVLLVQKEASERLRAPERTKDRGPLGVTLELLGTVEAVMKVSPQSFSPPPKVWSEIMKVSITQNVSLPHDSAWQRLVMSAFAQRRKKLVTNLQALSLSREQSERLLTLCEINENARAEELTSSQWFTLFSRYKQNFSE